MDVWDVVFVDCLYFSQYFLKTLKNNLTFFILFEEVKGSS